MKRFVLLLVVSCASLIRLTAQDVLRPAVAPKFGEPVTVQAKFVAKPNNYYSQNIIPEPYMLSVIAVDGAKLKAPVLIEYKLEVGNRDRSKWERLGVVFTFEAYETIYQTGQPGPWMEEWEQGRGFYMENLLHIRPVKRRANQALEPTGSTSRALRRASSRQATTAVTPSEMQEAHQ